MLKLKPCPFCGNAAILKSFDVFNTKWFYIKCSKCNAEINDPAPSEKMAANKWNRRADEANGAERIPHGCWQPSEIPHEKYVCSHCGGACWYYDYEGIVARSRFCPNCGAKMDEKLGIEPKEE